MKKRPERSVKLTRFGMIKQDLKNPPFFGLRGITFSS